MLGRILDAVLPVRRGERQLTGALFLHSLCAVGAFLTGRTVRDALFLANMDKSQLSWMYVASAIAVTVTGLIYGPLASRIRRHTMALGSASLFGALFVLLWFAERTHGSWVYPTLYVYVEVMGALVLVQFWTLANELFNAREAKRLYGLIGSGGTMANILIGLASARIATRFGTPALLLMCAALLGLTAIASFTAGYAGRQRLFAKAATGKQAAKRTGGAARVMQSSHLRAVAMLSAVTFLTTTLVDFQFKVIASNLYKGPELAAYFGYFSAVVGGLALVLQLFGTSKILNRAGVIGSLAVLPISLAFGNLALVIIPALWAASVAKGADTLFRYSINDATTQILYLPVPAQARASAKAFIDSVIKPIAIGVGGLALAAYRSFGGGDPYRLAWLSLVLSGVWVSVVVGLRSKYIKSLQENVKNKKLDLESARYKVLDASTNRVLERALGSSDTREVLNALALLPHLENVELDHKVEPLLDHSSPEVRTAALEYYGRRQAMRFANPVFKRFEDPDPGVRAAAIDAFCAIGQDKAVRSVRAFLGDSDPRIRSAAITGMIRYGGLDGVLVAAEALKALIQHQDPAMRAHAARVLGAIGVKNFYQPVLQLMSDPDLRVRREAINAASILKAQEFVIPLIYRSQDIETLREAVNALTAYGPAIVTTLGKVLGNQHELPSIRQAIARVLGKLASAESVELISQHLDEPDEELRQRLYRSLARAVRGRRLVLKDTTKVTAALERELRQAYSALNQAEVLGLGGGPSPDTPRTGERAAKALLASAMAEKIAQIERRIFLLLAVIYPDADMELIHAGMLDTQAADAARRRANAVELLDNLLERNLRKRFLPLLEELPRPERIKAVVEVYPQVTKSAREVLLELVKDETGWVRACATWVLAQGSTEGSAETFVAGATDHNPIVREISLVSLEKAAPDRVVRIAESRLRDEAPVVRQQAALIATRLAQLRTVG
ncbi:MAG: MFS transporter [Archangiaceae bacterium]|nr:MFS transporter [Archangiaceae bacterium]